jgi:hypothetical protein
MKMQLKNVLKGSKDCMPLAIKVDVIKTRLETKFTHLEFDLTNYSGMRYKIPITCKVHGEKLFYLIKS